MLDTHTNKSQYNQFISRGKSNTSEIRHQSDIKKDLKKNRLRLKKKWNAFLWTGVQCGD